MGDKLCNTHWSALSRQVRQLAVFGLTAQAVLLEVNSGGKKKRKEARDWTGLVVSSLWVPTLPLRRWCPQMARPSEPAFAGEEKSCLCLAGKVKNSARPIASMWMCCCDSRPSS